MVGKIVQGIILYNKAYALAWEQVSGLSGNKGSDIAVQLAVLIRSKISVGATDAATIAAEAVKVLEGR